MTNPNIQPVTRADVDKALLLLEHADIPAANLVRAYLAQLEGRLRVAELAADEDPGSWLYSWDATFTPGAKQRIWERLVEKIARSTERSRGESHA